MSAGFVLAGGRSSRMGKDKAGLVWNGQSLLRNAVEVVRRVCGNVVIIGDPSIHSVEFVQVISDRIQGAGPLGGIEAALVSSTTPWNLIVAVDMPMLTAEVLATVLDLAARQPTCDAIIPRCEGRPQPLCAAYHLSAVPAVQAALAAGTFKIMEALRQARVSHISIEKPASFRNVNTPEDWHALVSEDSA